MSHIVTTIIFSLFVSSQLQAENSVINLETVTGERVNVEVTTVFEALVKRYASSQLTYDRMYPVARTFVIENPKIFVDGIWYPMASQASHFCKAFAFTDQTGWNSRINTGREPSAIIDSQGLFVKVIEANHLGIITSITCVP